MILLLKHISHKGNIILTNYISNTPAVLSAFKREESRYNLIIKITEAKYNENLCTCNQRNKSGAYQPRV